MPKYVFSHTLEEYTTTTYHYSTVPTVQKRIQEKKNAIARCLSYTGSFRQKLSQTHASHHEHASNLAIKPLKPACRMPPVIAKCLLINSTSDDRQP